MQDQATWKDAVPLLDEALDRLPSQDRKVILQRFYEEKKFKEIASQNGQTESACKKRVQRALQKLSSMLTSRGVSLSATGLASLLGAEVARAVPAHITAAIAPKALAASSSVSSTTLLANTLQTMSTIKSTSITVAAVLVLAAIPISQQLAEGKRLRSDLQAIEGGPGDSGKGTTRTLTALRGQMRVGTADPTIPRTPRSILNSLSPAGAPDHRDLANQVMAAGIGGGGLAESIVIARLARLSEEEFDEFLREFDKYPYDDSSKWFLLRTLVARHPGLVGSFQGSVERRMEKGKQRWNTDYDLLQWVRKDPDAALTWYREKVASGEIYGKGVEESFELQAFRTLAVGLAESRPVEAIELFKSRPDELPRDAANDMTGSLVKAMIKSGDDTLVRQMLVLRDESDVLPIVLREYGRLESFGQGVAFVDQVIADPQQRTKILASGILAQTEVEPNHVALDWVRDNTPGPDAPELFRSVGAAGAIRGDWLEQQERGPIRDHGHLGIVERRVKTKNFPEALSRVGEIGDEELRATTMEMVGRQWLRHDEEAATQELPAEVLRRLRNQ